MKLPKLKLPKIDFAWVWSNIKRIVKTLCEHPSHLQRWAIIGAGLVLFPTVWVFVWLVRYSFGDQPQLYAQQLGILGNALYGVLALWGLTIVALLGIIRGLNVMFPGGASVDVDFLDPADGTENKQIPGQANGLPPF